MSAMYSTAVQRVTDSLTPEGGIGDAEQFSSALRTLTFVVGHHPSTVAMGLVDAGMDGEEAAEIAFNLGAWV